MDTVYIRYFGNIVKFKLENFEKFVEHLYMFRRVEGIENNYPPYSIGWYMDEFGIEEIVHPMDGPSTTFLDHRNDGALVILSIDEFEKLRIDRIEELSKTKRKKFDQAEILADDKQPMLEYLDIEILGESFSKNIIELKLPCHDDYDDDYNDMYYLGYRSGDRNTEKMARQIQFWRTYALSVVPDDREVKQQRKQIQRNAILYGKKGGRPIDKEVTVELFDTAIESAIKKIKLPTSKHTVLNKTNVFNDVAAEVKMLTGKSPSALDYWMRKNKITRDYIYEKMPDHIKDRMRK